MRSRSAFGWLLLTTALSSAAGCGAIAPSPASSPPDTSDGGKEPDGGQKPEAGQELDGGQKPEAGHEVLVASTLEGQLEVLHVDADALTALPYGPALPGLGAAVAAIAAIWSSPDLARVLVLVSTGGTAIGATGTSTLYAGDGSSWRSIETFPFAADPSRGRLVVSADASLLRTYDTAERLLGFDGSTVYTFPGTSQFAAFAPDASYFLYAQGSEIHARTLDGSDQIVAPPSPIGLTQSLEVVLPSSLVLSSNTVGGDLPAQGPAQLSFVDVDGNTLSIAGFDTHASALNVNQASRSSTTPSNIKDRFEVVGGRVMRLIDRGAQPLGTVPASIGAQNVILADARGTFVWDGSAWKLLDAAGNVTSTFAPPDPILCANSPTAPSGSTEVLLASLSTSPRWALLQVGHPVVTPGCNGDGDSPIGETDDVLWDMDNNRTQVLDARLGDTSWYGPEYQPSPDGTSLVWIHASAITRFRIPSFATDVIHSAAVPVETYVQR